MCFQFNATVFFSRLPTVGSVSRANERARRSFEVIGMTSQNLEWRHARPKWLTMGTKKFFPPLLFKALQTIFEIKAFLFCARAGLARKLAGRRALFFRARFEQQQDFQPSRRRWGRGLPTRWLRPFQPPSDGRRLLLSLEQFPSFAGPRSSDKIIQSFVLRPICQRFIDSKKAAKKTFSNSKTRIETSSRLEQRNGWRGRTKIFISVRFFSAKGTKVGSLLRQEKLDIGRENGRRK